MCCSDRSSAQAQTAWLTRSFDVARTGANTRETRFTPTLVGNNLMIKLFSMNFNDDPRLEAQPLYVPQVEMSDGKTHNVLFVCHDGQQRLGLRRRHRPCDLGQARSRWATRSRRSRQPHPGFPTASDIDMWGVNIKWGVLSTPVIDPDTETLYVVNWTSPDGSLDKASFQLHALNLKDGKDVHPPLTINATADVAGELRAIRPRSSSPRDRSSGPRCC